MTSKASRHRLLLLLLLLRRRLLLLLDPPATHAPKREGGRAKVQARQRAGFGLDAKANIAQIKLSEP